MGTVIAATIVLLKIMLCQLRTIGIVLNATTVLFQNYAMSIENDGHCTKCNHSYIPRLCHVKIKQESVILISH